MNRISCLFPLLTLVLTAVPGSRADARQVVMDFDHMNIYFPANIGAPLTEDGLVLNNTHGASSFYMFPVGHARNTGHKALTQQWTGTTTSVTAASGAPFTLVSMRLSPMTSGNNATLTFVGTKAGGGTVSQTFTTGTVLAGVVRTFSTDFQNILSVSWLNTGDGSTYSQFDDITAILPNEVSVAGPQTVTEGAGTASVQVQMTDLSAVPVNLTWTLTDGTATQPADYTRPGGTASGTLTIPAGRTSASLAIPIVNNTTAESLEQFTVTFSNNPSGTWFAGPVTTTVKIGDDDGITTFAGWMSAHGLTAGNAVTTADPNGDGISNLESWLFRLNPAGPSPAAWQDRLPAYVVSGGRPALRCTVPAPLPSDVGITLEESSNPATWTQLATRGGFGVTSLWTGSGSSRITETNAASGRTITMPGSQTVAARSRAWLRLKYAPVSGGTGSN